MSPFLKSVTNQLSLLRFIYHPQALAFVSEINNYDHRHGIQCNTLIHIGSYILIACIKIYFSQLHILFETSDVGLIKKPKYITVRILGISFWSGNLVPITKTSFLA